MNNQKYILDNGKIRHCDSNIRQMNAISYVYHFNGYKKAFFELLGAGQELASAIGTIITFVLYVVLFPIVPFVKAYTNIRRSKGK